MLMAGLGRAPEEGGVYADLLHDTRGLRREQAQARELWLARLPVERKVEHLFELEILLKGLACFANPRNHPGPPRKTPVVAQDFREHTALVREALSRAVHKSRLLLVERERAFVFQRYLETVLPDDRADTRLVGEMATQEAPERSLFLLRKTMTNLLEVTTGLTRLPRVPFRLFYALLGVARREIAQNAYFNPLQALEFRPEFDRIANGQVLELMRTVPGEQARRLVALTVLSLFRMFCRGGVLGAQRSSVRRPRALRLFAQPVGSAACRWLRVGNLPDWRIADRRRVRQASCPRARIARGQSDIGGRRRESAS
jgi:hypothetical protein